jgi:hypothetical protein
MHLSFGLVQTHLRLIVARVFVGPLIIHSCPAHS